MIQTLAIQKRKSFLAHSSRLGNLAVAGLETQASSQLVPGFSVVEWCSNFALYHPKDTH